MSSRILRYMVPVDDQDHEIGTAAGFILHVAARRRDAVEFWTMEGASGPNGEPRTFRVFATGQEIPDGYAYIGTGIVPGGDLVWHLMERV
jgi:hypothetical protein